jgi:hypothetical protein
MSLVRKVGNMLRVDFLFRKTFLGKREGEPFSSLTPFFQHKRKLYSIVRCFFGHNSAKVPRGYEEVLISRLYIHQEEQ